jgi:hypothetical protein
MPDAPSGQPWLRYERVWGKASGRPIERLAISRDGSMTGDAARPGDPRHAEGPWRGRLGQESLGALKQLLTETGFERFRPLIGRGADSATLERIDERSGGQRVTLAWDFVSAGAEHPRWFHDAVPWGTEAILASLGSLMSALRWGEPLGRWSPMRPRCPRVGPELPWLRYFDHATLQAVVIYPDGRYATGVVNGPEVVTKKGLFSSRTASLPPDAVAQLRLLLERHRFRELSPWPTPSETCDATVELHEAGGIYRVHFGWHETERGETYELDFPERELVKALALLAEEG